VTHADTLPTINAAARLWKVCPATCLGEHRVITDNGDVIVKHSDGQVFMVMPAAAYPGFVEWCEMEEGR